MTHPGQAGEACDGATYLRLIDELRSRFEEDDFPVHSFPELSSAAHRESSGEVAVEVQATTKPGTDAIAPVEAHEPYAVGDILEDGCFLDREEIAEILERLTAKKNVILQGPPGTGKTWLARRLGFALMGRKDPRRLRIVQFHPNLSYEDFVRGWRPTAEGRLALAEGVFMEAIKLAMREPSEKVVVVIEEINRGNPAQIFGESHRRRTAARQAVPDRAQLRDAAAPP